MQELDVCTVIMMLVITFSLLVDGTSNDLDVLWVFVQPDTDRRPVDWCRNIMSVLWL